MERKNSGGSNSRERRQVSVGRSGRGSNENKQAKRGGMTPAIAAIVAAIAVLVICTPLLIISFSSRSKEADKDEQIITAKELGFSVVTPSPASLEIPDATPVESEPTSGSGEYLYEKGINDIKLKEIQQRLMELGYMIEDETTDFFGPATEDAVELFQNKHGLKATGKIDQNTYDALFSSNAVFYTATVGLSGADVAEIQSLLKRLNYFTGSATGYFGTETESAVKKFQTANGLSADGKVGIKTLTVLRSSSAVAYVAPSPTPSAPASETPSEAASPSA